MSAAPRRAGRGTKRRGTVRAADARRRPDLIKPGLRRPFVIGFTMPLLFRVCPLSDSVGREPQRARNVIALRSRAVEFGEVTFVPTTSLRRASTRIKYTLHPTFSDSRRWLAKYESAGRGEGGP